MANQIFMRVNEVAEELGVSVPYAYKLIRQMNEELAKTGCITISGRIGAVDKPHQIFRLTDRRLTI